MDPSRSLRCKIGQSYGSFVVITRSEEMEKLRRKKEINARYSRHLLSKTIKHFQNQGHVTICLSEKLNGSVNDETLKIKKLKTNFQLNEPKHGTISFWQFPSTLKCEFQIQRNSPSAMKSVRTQTNFTRNNDKKLAKPCTSSNGKKTFFNTSSEILSSHVSAAGNVMSMVIRSQSNGEGSGAAVKSKTKIYPIARSQSAPSQRYRSDRNVIRSKNFWASYNNFILCNRSIELRITKLFSFRNTQYIVVFSKDFFDYTDDGMDVVTFKEKEVTYASSYIIQFIKFNFNACICELFFVEHVINLKTLIDCDERQRRHSENSESLPLLIQSQFPHFYAESTFDHELSKANTSANENWNSRAPSQGCISIVTVTILIVCVCVLSLSMYLTLLFE